MGPIAASFAGLTGAFAGFARSSEELLRAMSADPDADPNAGDPAKAIVGQVEAKRQVEASVRTLNVADEMLQDLLSLQQE